MKVRKEELLQIAELANLNIKEYEIDNYLKNLDDILNYVEILKNADIDNVKETIGELESENVFRKDEIKNFENQNLFIANAPEKSKNMYKIPRVVQE